MVNGSEDTKWGCVYHGVRSSRSGESWTNWVVVPIGNISDAEDERLLEVMREIKVSLIVRDGGPGQYFGDQPYVRATTQTRTLIVQRCGYDI